MKRKENYQMTLKFSFKQNWVCHQLTVDLVGCHRWKLDQRLVFL